MVDDGDTILSFDYPWHTHADLLACWYDQPRESATETFVTDLLNDRIVIVVARRGGVTEDISITFDPVSEHRYTPDGQSIELRYWSGTPWKSA